MKRKDIEVGKTYELRGSKTPHKVVGLNGRMATLKGGRKVPVMMVVNPWREPDEDRNGMYRVPARKYAGGAPPESEAAGDAPSPAVPAADEEEGGPGDELKYKVVEGPTAASEYAKSLILAGRTFVCEPVMAGFLFSVKDSSDL